MKKVKDLEEEAIRFSELSEEEQNKEVAEWRKLKEKEFRKVIKLCLKYATPEDGYNEVSFMGIESLIVEIIKVVASNGYEGLGLLESAKLKLIQDITVKYDEPDEEDDEVVPIRKRK